MSAEGQEEPREGPAKLGEGPVGTSQASHAGISLGSLPASVDVYDTTLRDGVQQEGISLSVEDKLRVARQLDHLGVAYIEAGWPGANPKDAELFARIAAGELELRRSTLVAFGSTRRPSAKAHEDQVLAHLVSAGTEAVCVVAKASAFQVSNALRATREEALAMVADSVGFLRGEGIRVFLDAEHLFDGFAEDSAFSLRVLETAEAAGAEVLVLCDTNGGTLPEVAEQVVAEVRARTSALLGVHFHNDCGCAIASSLAAVRAGATQVQGCVNGYGERAGNADLCAAIPNLSLKMGVETIGRERIELLTPVARHIAEIVNVKLDPQRPYVGSAVFAHKAGLHTSAIARRPDAYEHISPALVGNGARVVVSELAGRSTLALKAAELGLELESEALANVLSTLKQLEHAGYHFEVADGSLELLMRAAADLQLAGTNASGPGPCPPAPRALEQLFLVESFRVITDWRADEIPGAPTAPAPGSPATGTPPRASPSLVHPWSRPGALTTEATLKVHVGGQRVVATAEGNGPVNALDAALRAAITPIFPELEAVQLTDYRVRVLDTGRGTGAVTRVLVDSADATGQWSTIGVSENIIESSWQALVDAVVYGLVRSRALAAAGRSSPAR